MSTIPSPTYNDNLYICDATTATKITLKPNDTDSTCSYLIGEPKNDQKPTHESKNTRNRPIQPKAFRKAQRSSKKRRR